MALYKTFTLLIFTTKTLNTFFLLGDEEFGSFENEKDVRVHNISDNDNDEPRNALRDFYDFPMDDVGASSYNDIGDDVDDEIYFKENIKVNNKELDLDD